MHVDGLCRVILDRLSLNQNTKASPLPPGAVPAQGR
jgi:hypothetical protein